MRRAALMASALAVACSPEPRRAFPVGLIGPLTDRVEVEARRVGLVVVDRPPSGAAVADAAVVVASEVTVDWEQLRFLGARAAAKGADGLFFRLPSAPEGRDILDYPEEWQAVARVARELLAMRPILEGGKPAPAPFSVSVGIEAASWTFQGRTYVLMVNTTTSPAPVDVDSLASWRALFSVRSDPRQTLAACGQMRCLPPSGVLWLEGRLFSGLLP